MTAQDCPQRLPLAIRQFEYALTWPSLVPDWTRVRSGWITAVQEAASAAELAVHLLALERAMDWSSAIPQWRERRAGWITDRREHRTMRRLHLRFSSSSA